ncbi:hypothetical protein [Streptomyces sp. NBC_00457]|uniref:hypothetical protein n=1 Tax=Streptomyces sp. NBC_00457 TaxID=2975748 RepID=UPI003FCC9A51
MRSPGRAPIRVERAFWKKIAEAPASYTTASPFATLLIGNRLLSLPGSGKEVRQFANSPALVTEWLALTGLDPDTRRPRRQRTPPS